MKSLKQDTLAFQLGVRPGVQYRDMSKVPLPQVVEKLTQFSYGKLLGFIPGMGDTGETACGSPERDAIVFYLLNHAVSIVRQRVHPNEALGPYLPILEDYHAQLSPRATRMFYYLLLICTRESRHDKSSYSGELWAILKPKYGLEVYEFHTSIKGVGPDAAVNRLKETPPNVTLGAYTSFLCEVFRQGKYTVGFGGKAWGAVADVLRDFAHGKLTAEMMIDTAFTLCHNNGPIFNKGMLFEKYSPEIYKILDVQRSGQIPQMIANNETSWSKDPVVNVAWATCHHILGDAFAGYVDWFMVEELGALKSYKSEQAKQVSLHGPPPKFKAKVAAAKAKEEMAAQKVVADEKDMIEIMVGLKIKKVKVAREAA